MAIYKIGSEWKTALEQQISEKNKGNWKEDYEKRVNETIEKQKVYKQYEDTMKQEKFKYKEDYRRALEAQLGKNKTLQINISDDKKLREISKLENYKGAMIPGVYTIASVGSKPLYHMGNKYSIDNTPPKNPIYLKETVLYNPITNPIPMLTTNPYLKKQLSNYKN